VAPSGGKGKTDPPKVAYSPGVIVNKVFIEPRREGRRIVAYVLSP